MDNIRGNLSAFRWIPLPLDYLLDKYKLTSGRTIALLVVWIVIIAGSIGSVVWISPTKFMLIDQGATNQFFLFYPPVILSTLLLFWIGFEWGFIPLFLSGFIITYTASVTYYWGLLFGLAFVLGLAIYGLAYYCVPLDTSLRSLKGFAFFTVVSFFAAIGSSLGSFVWSDFFNLSPSETVLLWKGWWTGMFLQSMLIVAPILILFTPTVSKIRRKYFPESPKPKVTIGWIYSAIASVGIVLLLFIVGAKILGTEGLNQQLSFVDQQVGKKIVQTSESLQIVSWISIGLVLALSSGSIYLVGSWNNSLRTQVTQKTRQLANKREELQQALNDRDMLLGVIHKRVRNNLSMVLALLELQLKGEDEKSSTDFLKDSHSRVRSMALVHETMVQTNSVEMVNFNTYVVKLSNRLQKTFLQEDQNIEVSLNVDDIHIHINRAVSVALIINELMVNAFMHGFTDLKKGLVVAHITNKNGHFHLKVRNNGHPLPPNFDKIIHKTLGYRLIKTLVKQFQGSYKIIDKEDPCIEVIIPEDMALGQK